MHRTGHWCRVTEAFARDLDNEEERGGEKAAAVAEESADSNRKLVMEDPAVVGTQLLSLPLAPEGGNGLQMYVGMVDELFLVDDDSDLEIEKYDLDDMSVPSTARIAVPGANEPVGTSAPAAEEADGTVQQKASYYSAPKHKQTGDHQPNTNNAHLQTTV